MSVKSEAEELLMAALLDSGYTRAQDIEREYEFSTIRGWRFDFAWPAIKLAIEVQGSGYHNTDKGMRQDAQKFNAAVEAGWRLLIYPARCVSVALRREWIIEQIGRVICGAFDEELSAEVLTDLKL